MLVIITKLEMMGKIPLTIFKKYKVHLGGSTTVAVESRGHATSSGQLLTGMSKTELGQGAVCTVANLELKLCLNGQLAFAASHSVPGRSNVNPFS